jgi:hypothetical protein
MWSGFYSSGRCRVPLHSRSQIGVKEKKVIYKVPVDQQVSYLYKRCFLCRNFKHHEL